MPGVMELINGRRQLVMSDWIMPSSMLIFAMVVFVSVSFAQTEANSSDHKDIEALFILQNDTIHNYYLEESIKDCRLNNTTINVTIYDPDEASDKKLSSFDIIILYHITYRPSIQERLDEANNSSVTIYLSESAYLWRTNADPEIAKHAYTEYWVPSGIENHRRLLAYLAISLLGVDGEIQQGITLPRAGIFHPDYKKDKQPCSDGVITNISSYMEWYNESGKYHPGGPTVGLTLSSYYYANGYFLDDWIAIIREFENRSINVIPILDYTDLREFFFDEARNETRVDIVLSYMGTFHGTKAFNLSNIDERKEMIASLGVPWINCITTSQTPEEWMNSTTGIPNSYISWSVSLQEIEGLIEPIVIGGSISDELTGSVKKIPIAERADYVVDRTLMWTDLKYSDNKDKRIAFVYYSYPPGKAEIGASYLDVPRTLEVLLNKMHDAGYDLGVNFTPYNISDRNDSISNNGSIVVRLITQGRNIGTWAQGEVDELAKSGAVDLIPEEEYVRWFNEFPEDMQESVMNVWGPPPGDQMTYTSSNGSKFLVIPNIRYGNILLAPQPYRGYENNETLLYHNASMPPNHQYIAFYLWLKKNFNASALVHVGTHGTLEWLPGKQVGLDAKSWPEALIQDFPNAYIYIVDNVGEGTQAKRRGYSVIVDHMTPPFIPAGLYGNYSNLHQAIHNYQLAKENNNTLLMEKYKDTSAQIINDTHIDSDLDLNISLDMVLVEFEDLVVNGKVHDYLHEMMYTNMPFGLRIFANPISNESAVALVRGMLGDEYIAHIHDVNSSCDFHGAEEYNKTESYKLLYRVLLDGADFVSAQKETLGNSSPDVTHDLETAEEYYQNIISSSPKEMASLLDALNAAYVQPSVGGDVLRSPDVLPTGNNFYSFDPRTIPTKEAYDIGRKMSDELLVTYYETHGVFPEKTAFVLWGIETMRNHGIPQSQMLYLMGVEPLWDKNGRIIYYTKPSSENLHVMNISEMVVRLTNGTEIIRPRIDVVGHSSGLHRDQFPLLMSLLDDSVRLVSSLNESEDENYVKKGSLQMRQYLEDLMNSSNLTVNESEVEILSKSRVFGPPEGDYGVRISDAVLASDSWEDTDKIADQFIARSGNIYINGEMYSSPLISGQEVLKAALKGTDVAVFVRSSNLYGVLDSDDPFQYFGGLSLAIDHVSDGQRPEMWITNARDLDNPKMETLDEFMNMEKRTRMFNPNYIKGMMEHGYAGAETLQGHVEWLWGWDVVDTRFVEDDDWSEVYDVYIKDKYSLGTKEWFDRNSPWALQTMTARMLESSRKGYWSPTAEVKTELAEEYRQSVKSYGSSCSSLSCSNSMLDDYIGDILSSSIKKKSSSHHSSGSKYSPKSEQSELKSSDSAEAINQTESTTSSGAGKKIEAVAEPVTKSIKAPETSKTAENVEGKVMTVTETSSSASLSSSPIIAIIAVVAIISFVTAGIWLRRR